MPFPRVRHCIICDTVRQEIGNKSSILGFLGIAPDVAINIPSFKNALLNLTFFLVVDAPGQKEIVKLSALLYDKDGNKAVETPEFEFQFIPFGTTMNIALGLSNIRPTQPGKYRFTLKASGEQVYENLFTIDTGAQTTPG
jgi:hypothetical protein